MKNHIISKFQKYDCDRSGFTFRKHRLIRQRGLLVSPDEVDDISRIKQPNPRWRSPRSNSSSTDAVTTPTVYTIDATGITSISSSYDYSQDGDHQHTTMHIIGSSSGGAPENNFTFVSGNNFTFVSGDNFMFYEGTSSSTLITVDPQIVAGNDGDRLTLYGTSDTFTLTIQDGSGVQMIGGRNMVLKNKTIITFVYTALDSLWREVSRTEEAFI